MQKGLGIREQVNKYEMGEKRRQSVSKKEKVACLPVPTTVVLSADRADLF